jgi:hypothetical protein
MVDTAKLYFSEFRASGFGDAAASHSSRYLAVHIGVSLPCSGLRLLTGFAGR